jgi:hypothetical protein
MISCFNWREQRASNSTGLKKGESKLSFFRLTALLFMAIAALFSSACSAAQETTNAYTKARPAADSAATLITLKQLANAQQTYFARTASAGTFDQLVESGALDERFRGARPVVGGYVFTMNVTATPTGKPGAYSVNADPQTPAQPSTGTRHYFMESGGAIHYNDSQSASASDPLLQ